MNRLASLIGLITIGMIATACSAPSTTVEPTAQAAVESGEATVVSLEAKAGFDLTEEEVEIVLRGTFSHPCARINRVNQEIAGKKITLQVETDRSGKDGCESRLGSVAEFIHVVPIDVEVLQQGVYLVELGTLQTSFEIQ